MTVLDELKVYAAGLAVPAVPVLLVDATNLFAARMPPDPDQVVCFMETPGRGGDYALGINAPQVEHPHVQVYCRDLDYAAARAMAEALYKNFDAVGPTQLSGTYYLNIDPLQPPFPLEVDARDRWGIVFNCEVWKSQS